MIRAKQKKLIFILIILGSIFSLGSIHNREFIPLSSGGSGINSDLYTPLFLKDAGIFEVNVDSLEKDVQLREFISSVTNGSPDVVRGIYSPDNFALPVVQQPSGQSGYVSTVDGVVTQFSMPAKYNVTGILAHNYLSGKYFYSLDIGDIVQIIYGDGEIRSYKVTDIQRYQALQPNSSSSQFVNLDTGERLTATQLFKRVYMGNHHITLQTCIQEGSENSWGRLFVIAQPI